MNDENKMDDRYVGFREHAAAQQRTDAELARIRERQATTEATLIHEIAAVRSDVGDVKQLILKQQTPAPPAPPPVDHMALAMQRWADVADKQKGGASPILIIFAILGALALGFLGARFLMGT